VSGDPLCVAGSPQADTGQFRFLSNDSGNTGPLATGEASGLIGHRFSSLYQDVRVTWDTSRFIQFRVSNFDIFGGGIALAQPVTSFSTSEAALRDFVNSAGGAIFCVSASPDLDARPGDTSWAIKPKDDAPNTQCGCNGYMNPIGWIGRGAYYGGTGRSGPPTVCCGWGGGWAGVKANLEQKGGLTAPYETQIWIR
jgi:hypothetical protein